MSERLASRNFVRPLDGLGLDEMVPVVLWATEQEQLTKLAVRDMFFPLTIGPEATIVDADELRRLHELLGITPDDKHLDKLDKHIMKALPATAGIPLPTDLLPSRTHSYDFKHHKRGVVNREALTVAYSDIVAAERFAAQTAIRGFFEDWTGGEFPEVIWDEDMHIVPALLAKGDGPRQISLIQRMSDQINARNRRFDRLPEQVTLLPATSR